ncbi:MAG TPA: hypothetical protein VIV35_04120 [Chitinophagaceae bacterium]
MTHADFYSNFFVVEDPVSTKNYRGDIINPIDEPGALLRNEYKVNQLDIKYMEGSNEPGSLFWNSVTDPFCISGTFVDILHRNNITGWSTIPAKVLTKSGSYTIDNFFALTVTGRANAIDYLQTDIVFRLFPGGQFPHFKGLYFDPESWDGSDIFMERPDSDGKSSAFIYVTKKFVDTCKKNKVKNIRFVSFNDYLTDCEMIKIGSTEIMKMKIDEKIKKACA